MSDLAAVRRRVPLVVFLLLLVLVLLAVGFACACASDHPGKAVDRALGALAHAPGVLDVWALLPSVLLPLTALVALVHARERASPALLQRFLF